MHQPRCSAGGVCNIPYISAQSKTASPISGGTASASYYYNLWGQLMKADKTSEDYLAQIAKDIHVIREKISAYVNAQHEAESEILRSFGGL